MVTVVDEEESDNVVMYTSNDSSLVFSVLLHQDTINIIKPSSILDDPSSVDYLMMIFDSQGKLNQVDFNPDLRFAMLQMRFRFAI